jgi:ELWxxDGT repeat protein
MNALMLSCAGARLHTRIAPIPFILCAALAAASDEPNLAAKASSNPSKPVVAVDQLFFAANDGVNGRELWKSDGTEAGTELVKDINPGEGDSNPKEFCAVGSLLYFQANDGIHGAELWVTDGTNNGTHMVKDLYPGQGESTPHALCAVDKRVFFAADTGNGGADLWVSDGTLEGTHLVAIANPGRASDPVDLVRFGNGVAYRGKTDDNG